MDDNPNGEATLQACNALLVEADAFDPLTIPNSPFHDRAVKIEAYRKIAEMDNSVYFCKPSTIESFELPDDDDDDHDFHYESDDLEQELEELADDEPFEYASDDQRAEKQPQPADQKREFVPASTCVCECAKKFRPETLNSFADQTALLNRSERRRFVQTLMVACTRVHAALASEAEMLIDTLPAKRMRKLRAATGTEFRPWTHYLLLGTEVCSSFFRDLFCNAKGKRILRDCRKAINSGLYLHTEISSKTRGT